MRFRLTANEGNKVIKSAGGDGFDREAVWPVACVGANIGKGSCPIQVPLSMWNGEDCCCAQSESRNLDKLWMLDEGESQSLG